MVIVNKEYKNIVLMWIIKDLSQNKPHHHSTINSNHTGILIMLDLCMEETHNVIELHTRTTHQQA